MQLRAPALSLLAASILPTVAHGQRAATPTAHRGSHHVTQKIVLGGDGSWDYITVDTARNRLFIARADRMMVIDERTGKLLGEIGGLDRAHGVALAYPTGRGFITSGEDSTVVMFDLATLERLGKIGVSVDDDATQYDPVSRDVFTFNGDAASASVIDPVAGKRIATIPLGGKPEFGVTDGAGHLFVNIADKNEVVEIDAHSRTVTRRWAVPCTEPTSLAIDVAHERLFSGCRSKVLVVSDASAGKVVTTVPIGGGVDAGRFDPATGDVFTSNGDGTLTVIHEDAPNRYHVVQTVPTMQGARTMELDPRTHTIYTVSAKFGPRPAPTAANPHPYPPVLPGTFTLLVIQR